MGITIFAGNPDSLFVTNERAAQAGLNASSQEKKSHSFFAGDFGLRTDPIEARQKFAQKQAVKLIRDSFAREQKTDQELADMRSKQEAYLQDSLLNKQKVKELSQKGAERMAEYGVTEDSDEQQDLELLRREAAGGPLTPEERSHLDVLHQNGLTDYQKDMLELDAAAKIYTERADQSQAAASMISDSVSSIELERLKTHPIADALGQAEDIMKAANKEILGALLAEAKGHLDEEMAEKAKEAEEKKEAKEEEEELEAKQKAKQAELEKQIEEARQNADQTDSHPPVQPLPDDTSYVNGGNTQPKYLEELEKLTDELNLILEDLKGIYVNTGI